MTVGQSLVEFTVAAGLLTLVPGLDTALVLRTSAAEGPGRGMLAGFGICSGLLIWGAASAIGIGALLAASTAAYDVLRFAGAAYLVYLGAVMIWKSGRPAATGRGQEIRGASNWYARGLMTNLLNPKVAAFYAAFLPQFLPEGVPAIGFSVLLASIHAAEGILWFLVLTQATRLASGWLRNSALVTAIDRITGAALIGFGAKLLVDRRG